MGFLFYYLTPLHTSKYVICGLVQTFDTDMAD